MIRGLKRYLGTLLAVLLLGLGGGRTAHSACFADCNGSMTLTASDIGRINVTILRCSPCEGGVPGGVAAGCAAFTAGCTAADLNSDGCLRASELGRANRNILTFETGCAPEDTPTGGPALTSTPTAEPTATPTTIVGPAKCGDMTVQPPEECDDGGACFGGANEGQLCTSDAQCPGGACNGFGGDGCAANCTNEKELVFVFTGANCEGGAKDGQPCTFKQACAGGTKQGRPCITNNDCPSSVCQSECGADSKGCYGDGECTRVGTGFALGQDCLVGTFCASGPNAGQPCSGDAQCGGVAGSCAGTCGSGGECSNKSRAALVSGNLSIPIGPLIGQSKFRYGSPGEDGIVRVAVGVDDGQFNPIIVPGLVCACVSGGEDPGAHGPGNSGSGLINCGAGTIANDVTLSADHNTSTPNICLGGTNDGMPCVPRCQAGGTRGGLPCSVIGSNPTECPGSVPQRQCRPDTDCPGGFCNLNNGPGRCVGGNVAGRSCLDSNICTGGGVCTGRCIFGANTGAACNCTVATARGCANTTQCGADGICRIDGTGGGFCAGPPRFCAGGANAGRACYNNSECPGGSCPGSGNFLAYCDSNDDCPGSVCNSVDDPTCTAVDPGPPAGSGDTACKETREVCVTGTNQGSACNTDTDCGVNGLCANTCNTSASHVGTCNSPTHITLSGAGAAGSGIFLNTTAIGTIAASEYGARSLCSMTAVCSGGSNDLGVCFINADCPGGTCATALCAGKCGSSQTLCFSNADCSGDICNPGPNFKTPCSSPSQCGEGGTCRSVSVAQGLDGLPCTSDDSEGAMGVPNTIPQTTGRSATFIADASNIGGAVLVHQACLPAPQDPLACITSVVGTPINCDLLASQDPTASGVRLATTFPSVDGQTGDAAVSTFLTAR